MSKSYRTKNARSKSSSTDQSSSTSLSDVSNSEMLERVQSGSSSSGTTVATLLPMMFNFDSESSASTETTEDQRFASIEGHLHDAAAQFDLPVELLAAILQTENNTPDQVETWGQALKRTVQREYAKVGYGYGTAAPTNEATGPFANPTFGLANIAPNTAVTIMNRLQQYRPDLLCDEVHLTTRKEVIDAIDDDRRAIFLMAANIRGYIELNAAKGNLIAGDSLPTQGASLSTEQMAFLAKYHNDPSFDGDGHWAQEEVLKLLEAHNSGEQDLKFLQSSPSTPNSSSWYMA